jgi:hypothetical protein
VMMALSESVVVRSGWRMTFTICITILTAAIIFFALVWPFYDAGEIFPDGDQDFHRDSRALYIRPWLVTSPLLVLAVLCTSNRDPASRMLLWSAFAMALTYLAGWVLSFYGLGRAISGFAWCCQSVVGLHLALNGLKRRRALVLLLSLALVVVFLTQNSVEMKRQVGILIRKPDTDYYKRYRVLHQIANPGELIIADESASQILPCYGFRVLASRFPLYGVSDHEARRRDIRIIFNSTLSPCLKLMVCNNYPGRILLIDLARDNFSANDITWLGTVLHKTSQDRQLIAFRLRQDAGCK